MPKTLRVKGSQRISGEIVISGAKNAAIPIIAASLLTESIIHLANVPQISDVNLLLTNLKYLGKDPARHSHKVLISNCSPLPEVLDLSTSDFGQIRGSLLLIGPLLARTNELILPYPGGCRLGHRGIDFHLTALEKLGCRFEFTREAIHVFKEKPLTGATHRFDTVTVGGTENLMMAACLATGVTIIENAAKEVEVIQLAQYLKSMGANIVGEGTDTIRIEGVKSLSASETPFPIIGDRIEAATYLIAATMTGGDITVRGVKPESLLALLPILSGAGTTIETGDDHISLTMMGTSPVGGLNITTAPFPGLATDIQPILMAMAATMKASSSITETVFTHRFQCAGELFKMGAKIDIREHKASIEPVPELVGTSVEATDLRAGAALLCAALTASGETEILHAEQLFRGYEALIDKLSTLGVTVEVLEASLPIEEEPDTAPSVRPC